MNPGKSHEAQLSTSHTTTTKFTILKSLIVTLRSYRQSLGHVTTTIMPPMKNASKKRTRQAGTKGPAKKKQAGSLSLDFVQDLLDESLVANGIVKEDTEDEADDSDAEPDVSGDENEASYVFQTRHPAQPN